MIRPLLDTIVIRPIEPTTKSGLIIPDSAKKPPISRGEVVAAGKGRAEFGVFTEMPVKVGEIVSYLAHEEGSPYPEVEEDGETFTLIRTGEILCAHEPG